MQEIHDDIDSQNAVYPGSFDPLTRGHLDIIQRGAGLFKTLTVAVIYNPNKNPHFTLDERKELLSQACRDLKNVSIDSFQGLLVDYLRQRRASTVIRGLRHAQDLEGEFQMARLNQEMHPTMDTVFLASRPQHIHISSTFVREIARLGGDFSALVPVQVYPQILRKYSGKDLSSR